MAALAEASRALVQRLDDDGRARRDESGRLHDALAQRLDQAGSKLGDIADQVGQQLAARLSSETDLGAQLGAAMSQFERSGRALDAMPS